jgi:uncharacterized protein with GYD domain
MQNVAPWNGAMVNVAPIAPIKDFYLTLGRYDVVAVGEVPDDETAAKLALSLSSAGAIRTETLRAFTEDEYRDIIAALP